MAERNRRQSYGMLRLYVSWVPEPTKNKNNEKNKRNRERKRIVRFGRRKLSVTS